MIYKRNSSKAAEYRQMQKVTNGRGRGGGGSHTF